MDIVGIGSDIVECLRIGRMIEMHGELFLTRVYTDREIRYCQALLRRRAFCRTVGGQGGHSEEPGNRLAQGPLLDRHGDSQRYLWSAAGVAVRRRQGHRPAAADQRHSGLHLSLSELCHGLRPGPSGLTLAVWSIVGANDFAAGVGGQGAVGGRVNLLAHPGAHCRRRRESCSRPSADCGSR